MAQEQAFAPIQLNQFTPEDFQGDLSAFNQHQAEIVKRLNALTAAPGVAQFPKGIDLAGNSIANVGAVGPEHAAVSAAQVEKNYGAKAMAEKLNAGGPHALKGMRHLNSNAQQEKSSVFLQSIMHTVPTSNSATISGSGGDVTVSAGYHYYPGGKVVPFASRTDSFPLPSSVAISTLVRTNGVVTATTSAPVTFSAGSVQSVQGVADPTFNGEFVIQSASGTSFTYAQIAPNGNSTGGTVGGGNVYYYFLKVNDTTLSLAGPYTADTQENRLAVNRDGSVLIAVALLSPKGFDPTQSAAGATPPAQTNGNRLINRM